MALATLIAEHSGDLDQEDASRSCTLVVVTVFRTVLLAWCFGDLLKCRNAASFSVLGGIKAPTGHSCHRAS